MHRVGDSDRERALELLRRHYADGRLSVEELEERCAHVARAQTTRELRPALRELPWAQAEVRLTPMAGRAVRLFVGLALLGVWAVASFFAFGVFLIAQLLGDPSGETSAAFVLGWIVLSWLLFRAWRGGMRRVS